ncbi:hypothetical protein BU14_0497s0003 [Porphyra umbilicalis]|uniref:Magnesium-dependent phosphatase-1 n=1 Tax=Porphyra umbilicalis TaxID=2786 RepID=A0A1X6NT76_PORUM|nr:hypothetical protein BU14_0497s0003 [Porphyra umbilicalis]|eukprot:OSX71839.1 hypothetical protein BU14_0497s0003 [Porphyra umbilicalis]
MERPLMVVLDLDGLCWWPEMYMLSGKPRRSPTPPHHPAYARAALAALPVAPGVAMADVGAVAEIYPGRKQTHLARIRDASGVAYDAMLFFDNERRNCVDVAGLGVLAVYAPDGLTADAWAAGLAAFAGGDRGVVVENWGGGGGGGRRGRRRRW